MNNETANEKYVLVALNGGYVSLVSEKELANELAAERER